jgi:L-cysteine S-thiosulfotransferase
MGAKRASAISLATLVMMGACVDKTAVRRELAGAEPERGLAAIEAVGCGACHDIPGVRWPRGQVGGSLSGFANRPLIAGRLPNQPDVLIRWLRDAPSLSPQTGMPPQPLNERQARDVAAYLYGLDDG